MPVVTLKNDPPTIHYYSCKISIESRKVLYLKNPQHYLYKAADQFHSKFNWLKFLSVISSARLISIRPNALLLLTGLECFKRCLTFS